MFVYIRSEEELWTVGFYKPNGEWMPESDWRSPEEAAERVHYLNGGRVTAVVKEGKRRVKNIA